MKIAKIIMDSTNYSMCEACTGTGEIYECDWVDPVICEICQSTGKTRTICVVAEVEVPWNYTLENTTND